DHAAGRELPAGQLHGALSCRHVGVHPGPARLRPDPPGTLPRAVPQRGWLAQQRSGRAEADERQAMTESGYLAPGAVLCRRYEIVREIGRGGYSVVYLARDRELEADVALKLLVP